jgi:transcriptional regulator with XRE-family HTH domain
MDIFALRLNKLIKENKITRYRLAKDLQCSKQSVINWCEGMNEPKATQIRRLALYFDVSADYLLGLEDETGAKVR